jgi:hypothetical protein
LKLPNPSFPFSKVRSPNLQKTENKKKNAFASGTLDFYQINQAHIRKSLSLALLHKGPKENQIPNQAHLLPLNGHREGGREQRPRRPAAGWGSAIAAAAELLLSPRAPVKGLSLACDGPMWTGNEQQRHCGRRSAAGGAVELGAPAEGCKRSVEVRGRQRRCQLGRRRFIAWRHRASAAGNGGGHGGRLLAACCCCWMGGGEQEGGRQEACGAPLKHTEARRCRH